MPLEYLQRHFLRCVAESNHCDRFCRPAPNHSANAPFGSANIRLFSRNPKDKMIFWQNTCDISYKGIICVYLQSNEID